MRATYQEITDKMRAAFFDACGEKPEDLPEQIDLFTDYSAKEKQKKEADTAYARERKLQETMLGIKKRFGKNAILKGLNLEDGATAKERNNQIGGHKA